MTFSVSVNIKADLLSEWLEMELSFEEVMQELGNYHAGKHPETSVIPFDASLLG